MRYHDLDLRLGRRSGSAGSIQARCASTHGAREDNAWVFDDGRARSSVETGEGLPFELAFPTAVHLQFERCLGAALDAERAGVRLRLRIEDPQLAAFPWEYLREDSGWLGTSVRTPVVRYLDLPEPTRPLTAVLPLRMLVVIPRNPDLDAAAEKRILETALAGLGDAVEATFVEGDVTRIRLTEAVESGDWHILHYIGHGHFDGDRAVLLLNAPAGTDAVDADWVAALLNNQDRMRLVVLNSCHGATTSAARPLAGMAARLVQAGVPAVVAMQDAIADDEALHFARVFYSRLLRGNDRGRVDVAICHARNELLKEGRRALAVGIPVLFLRSPDGVIFNIQSSRDPLPWSGDARDSALLARQAVGRVAAQAREEGRHDVAEQETKERSRLAARIRIRDASIGVAVGVALLAFFALWLGLFDWLPKQLKPEHYTVWLGDLFRTYPLHEDVVLVTIDTATIRAAGMEYDAARNAFGPEWRAAHARVLDNLAAAGAAAVAFDIVFATPAPGVDTALARSVRNAAASGTPVILAARDWTDASMPGISPALLEAGARWGTACLGLPRETPNVVPLLARQPAGPAAASPALSLAAVAAFDGARAFDLDAGTGSVALLADGTITRRVSAARIETITAQRACPILRAGDRVGNMIASYAPRAELAARRIAWEAVGAGEASALSRVAGRIVLVGAEVGPERFPVWRGLSRQQRYGVELHADAISTLLAGRSTRWLSNGAQFALIMLMALGGVAAANSGFIRPVRFAALGVLAAGYTIVALGIYLSAGLLANALYHVLALFAGYRVARSVKRRFYA